MEPISEKEVRELEGRAAYLKGEKARTLKEEVAKSLATAEAAHVGSELIDRLDVLITTKSARREASRSQEVKSGFESVVGIDQRQVCFLITTYPAGILSF
jgi:hypothetical protein